MKRILTGIRPTGALHLGHYVGALENWLRLQHEYDRHFLLADYQVSDYADDMARVRESVWEVALDWLAVGLDPEKSCFVIESLVPENAELTTWLSWFLPLGMLQRNPTLKAEMDDFGKKSVPVAFFTYPVMQVANILLPRAPRARRRGPAAAHRDDPRDRPPLQPAVQGGLPGAGRARRTRAPARRHGRPGEDEQVPEQRDLPQGPPAVVTEKVRAMYTDPTRLRATDPGHVEGNPVFMHHDAFNPNRAEVDELKDRYRRGAVGDVEVKQKLAAALNAFLDPIRERRARYEANMSLVRNALEAGTARARAAAQETMALVRDALDLGYLEKHRQR